MVKATHIKLLSEEIPSNHPDVRIVIVCHWKSFIKPLSLADLHLDQFQGNTKRFSQTVQLLLPTSCSAISSPLLPCSQYGDFDKPSTNKHTHFCWL